MDDCNRKKLRLGEYDYSSPAAYFVTICTKDRQNYFWSSPIPSRIDPKGLPLSPNGKIAAQYIEEIPCHYPAIRLEQYVIMPDHVHLLLQVCNRDDGTTQASPDLSRVIQQLKGIISKRIGTPLWQKGFYDHVIRNEADFEEIRDYIQCNPLRWAERHDFTLDDHTYLG